VSANIDWLQLGGPVTATVTVENTGNTDFTMTEYIQIKNVLGSKVYEAIKREGDAAENNERHATILEVRTYNGSYTTSRLRQRFSTRFETTSSWVLLMPMWILVLSILATVGIIYWAIRSRRR
jgi:hypothetical protein